MLYFSLTLLAFIVLFTFFYSQLNSVGRLAQLVVLYLLVSLIYIMLDFTFMGLAYIIVYCGAIAIIFLFVIMMISTSKANLRTSTIPLLLYTG
jgi:NADH-ubiquinone oxidoreductase chain 6